MARKCVAQGPKKSKQVQYVPINQIDLRGEIQVEEEADLDQEDGIHPEVTPEEGWKQEDEVKLVPFDLDKSRRNERIGLCLSLEEKVELTAFFQNNKDMFAWLQSDMLGIDPQIVCHRLHVSPASIPVAQKRRNFTPE
ncbi:unnamed protein product [Prunus brigantina]